MARSGNFGRGRLLAHGSDEERAGATATRRFLIWCDNIAFLFPDLEPRLVPIYLQEALRLSYELAQWQL